MKKKLKSRYDNVITEYEDIDSNSGLITTNSYIRYSPEEDGSLYFIDFDGGPFITVGSKLFDRTIKRMKDTKEGIKIIFK